MELYWSREAPTEQGWYWMKRLVHSKAAGLMTAPCLVYLDENLRLPGFGTGDLTVNKLSGSFNGVWWAGPIPEPSEKG